MLTTDSQVTDRLGRTPTPDETARIPGLIAEATALVTAWLRHTPDPPPEGLTIIVSRVVARTLTTAADPGTTSTSTTIGPFTTATTYNPQATNGGVWLTRSDKQALRPWQNRHAASWPTS